MSTQTPSRPAAVDELKRAWHAVNAGEFRTGPGAGKGPRGRARRRRGRLVPAKGEHTIAVLGSAGSVGASTVALATGSAAAAPVRVIECCSAPPPDSPRRAPPSSACTDRLAQGKRDHVLLERASEVLAGVDEVPCPTEAEHVTPVTILDVGWEAGQLLATECWLAEAVRTADHVVLVTTATVPGMRRLAVAMDLLSTHWQPEQLAVAVRGPRRKKWPRGLEHAGGPASAAPWTRTGAWRSPRTASSAVNGLDSRPVPAPVISAARQLLDPLHLAHRRDPTA